MISDNQKDKKEGNPRAYLDIPLSNKPNEGDPKNNIKKTQQKNKMLDQRRKIQQEKERQKLDAIEAKIENARKRLEEKKKIKSTNAKNTVKRLG